jgi:zinc protease
VIDFYKFTLPNGLRVVIHEDFSTPFVATNMLYDVGARDESPDRTGLAHLFEHLMFEGTHEVKDFDEPIQRAGGENNAFTNSDTTNFYNVLPAKNLETALWLESNRMFDLNLNQEALELQKKVVIEEFYETCLNQPFGDAWHHLSALAYKVHPYRWPTIGRTPEHIAQFTLKEVKAFYDKYYYPGNAILSICGPITVSKAEKLVQKWFGCLPKCKWDAKCHPSEPVQRSKVIQAECGKTPVDALFMAFKVPKRIDTEYYTADVLSDILASGDSSRLYSKLLKEKKLFNAIDAYVTGNIDPGLLVIEGKPAKGVALETAEKAIWNILDELKVQKLTNRELEKVKNKISTHLSLSELSAVNKAINLGFYELLGNASIINLEYDFYNEVSPERVQNAAIELLEEASCSVLQYKSAAE